MTPPGGGRIEAVDLARGCALAGMMFAHLGPHWIGWNPPVGVVLTAGRAAPLFALLAGVALTIVHRRDPRGAGSLRATLIRSTLLIVLGLWLGSLDDMPMLIILVYYGVLILAAFPFRRLPTRWLIGVALGWSLAAPVVHVALRIHHEPVRTGQAELSELGSPLDLLTEIVVWGGYPGFVWLSYLLVGLAVGRLDLRSVHVAARLVAVGGALTIGTLLVGYFFIGQGWVNARSGRSGWRLLVSGINPFRERTWDELLLVGAHTSTPLNVLSALGSALLVLGLCALLVRLRWARLVSSPLVAAGAMTLTLYTLHVVWSWRIRVGFLADHPGESMPGSYAEWLTQVVVLCAAAWCWHRWIGKGPLEWLMRRLSVWSLPRWAHKKSAPEGA